MYKRQGMLCHQGLAGVGRHEDWATHGLEHELSAFDTSITPVSYTHLDVYKRQMQGLGVRPQRYSSQKRSITSRPKSPW